MTYNQLNAAIDELNKPFVEKYKILGMKRLTLNDVNRKRYEKYKLQETKDTAGMCIEIKGFYGDHASFRLSSCSSQHRSFSYTIMNILDSHILYWLLTKFSTYSACRKAGT